MPAAIRAATLSDVPQLIELLMQAGENALAGRGRSTAFVVCPAAWTSRIALLERAGYEPAMSWMIKR